MIKHVEEDYDVANRLNECIVSNIVAHWELSLPVEVLSDKLAKEMSRFFSTWPVDRGLKVIFVRTITFDPKIRFSWKSKDAGSWKGNLRYCTTREVWVSEHTLRIMLQQSTEINPCYIYGCKYLILPRHLTATSWCFIHVCMSIKNNVYFIV